MLLIGRSRCRQSGVTTAVVILIYSNLLYYVTLCYVMLCYGYLCYVMLCYVMLCYVMVMVIYFIPSSESSAYLKQIKSILSAVKKYRIFSLVTDTIFIFSL